MTKTVWKYPIGFGGIVAMPEGAEVLHVGTQNSVPTLWALVDRERQAVERRFLVVPTGEDVPWAQSYCGTVHVGPFVYHIFEAL